MMATVLRKVKLCNNKNKSDSVTDDNNKSEIEKDRGDNDVLYNNRRISQSFEERVVPCGGRVCGLVNVCTGPADSMEKYISEFF